jgi:hypothetical protein
MHDQHNRERRIGSQIDTHGRCMFVRTVEKYVFVAHDYRERCMWAWMAELGLYGTGRARDVYVCVCIIDVGVRGSRWLGEMYV